MSLVLRSTDGREQGPGFRTPDRTFYAGFTLHTAIQLESSPVRKALSCSGAPGLAPCLLPQLADLQAVVAASGRVKQ